MVAGKSMKTLTRKELNKLISDAGNFIPKAIWINGQRLIWDYELKSWFPDGKKKKGDETLIISK